MMINTNDAAKQRLGLKILLIPVFMFWSSCSGHGSLGLSFVTARQLDIGFAPLT